MSRDGVIATVCDAILALKGGRPAAVAIDGLDAAGKTTFADALVAPLETRGAVVVRASVDDFEHPRTRAMPAAASRPRAITVTALTARR